MLPGSFARGEIASGLQVTRNPAASPRESIDRRGKDRFGDRRSRPR